MENLERAEPFYTLENAVYMSMHNDLSFIIDMRLSLYEHQSTRNPNLPLRFFILLSAPLLEYGKPAYARGAGVPPPRKSLAGVLGIPECMPPIRRRTFRVKDKNLYGRQPIPLPAPHFMVFYNGEEELPGA